MEDIKVIARAAKQRLKSNFWDECKRSVEAGTNLAVQRGFRRNFQTDRQGVLRFPFVRGKTALHFAHIVAVRAGAGKIPQGKRTGLLIFQNVLPRRAVRRFLFVILISVWYNLTVWTRYWKTSTKNRLNP